jgi:hypothetical protein
MSDTRTDLGTVSRHFLRRTARDRERKLETAWPDMDFKVLSLVRGPFGWRVIRTR